MERSNVSTVICAGEERKWQGQLLGHDLANLRTRIEASREALFERAVVAQDLFRL